MRRFSFRETCLLIFLFSIFAFIGGLFLQPPTPKHSSTFIHDMHILCVSGSILSGKDYETILKECSGVADLRCASLGYVPVTLTEARMLSRHPDDANIPPDTRCQNLHENEYYRLKRVIQSQ